MEWMAIVSALISALLPILTKWLESLLKESAQELASSGPSPEVVTPEDGVRRLFAGVRDRMTWWQRWWYSGLVNRMERATTKRAQAVWSAVRESRPVEFSWGELREIRGE